MNGGGVDAVDQEKLTGLMALWIEHEFWIQAGCPESQRHWIVFPGYASIAEQDVRGYDAYRHSLVPYFAEAQGFRGIHDSLQKLVGDAEAKHPALFNELMAQYEDPDGRFRAQWGNLFCSIFNDGLSHRTLLDYQKKFEIELPLCFLAQLRELVTKGSFDKNLDRFRDRAGSLKKGVIAQFIIDGLSSYSELHSIVASGYLPKLRNAVGHNAYVIENDVFRAIDNELTLTRLEFSQCFNALQTFQNAVIWYLRTQHTQFAGLNTKGVIALGWAESSEPGNRYSQLMVFQLAPFYNVDPACSWLRNISIAIDGNFLVTELSNSHPIRGEYVKELRGVLELIVASGRLQCFVIPIMPCLHKHTAFELLDGEYCEVLGRKEMLLQACVVT